MIAGIYIIFKKERLGKMFFASNMPPMEPDAGKKVESSFQELGRANSYEMEGPVEVLQIRSPADKSADEVILFESNVLGSFYTSIPSPEWADGMKKFSLENRNSLHTHEYYEFMFVIDGEIYQNIEHDRHYYPAGGCCLVDPYVLHTEEYDTECRVLFFKVSREFMQQILSFPRYFPVEKNRTDERLREYLDSDRHFIDFIPANGYEWIQNHIHKLFEKMIYELSAPSAGTTLKLALYTHQLLMELFDEVKFSNTPATSGRQGDQELFYRIRDYMTASEKKVTRSDLEAHFNYSGDNIYKIIKNYTGLSIHDYGSYLCMKKAAELLISTDRNINEIAEEVGFHNFTQFYKEFKNYYHMTPKEYRKWSGQGE